MDRQFVIVVGVETAEVLRCSTADNNQSQLLTLLDEDQLEAQVSAEATIALVSCIAGICSAFSNGNANTCN